MDKGAYSGCLFVDPFLIFYRVTVLMFVDPSLVLF